MKKIITLSVLFLSVLTNTYASTDPEAKIKTDKKTQLQENSQEALKLYNSLNEEGKKLFRQLIVDSVAVKLNQDIPFKIDSYTTLTKVINEKNGQLTFNYTLNSDGIKLTESSKTQEIKDFMKKVNVLNACYKEDTKIFFDLDITINYVYSYNQKEILQFSINKNDCQSKKNGN